MTTFCREDLQEHVVPTPGVGVRGCEDVRQVFTSNGGGHGGASSSHRYADGQSSQGVHGTRRTGYGDEEGPVRQNRHTGMSRGYHQCCGCQCAHSRTQGFRGAATSPHSHHVCKTYIHHKPPTPHSTQASARPTHTHTPIELCQRLRFHNGFGCVCDE